MTRRSLRKDHRFIAKNSLIFDNNSGAVIDTTSEIEKCSFFWSRYMETVNPFEKFPKFWEKTAIEFEIHIKHIKDAYRRYVLNGSWSEDKFIIVTNEIFDRELRFNQFDYDKFSREYDKGNLGSKRTERRRRVTESRKRRTS